MPGSPGGNRAEEIVARRARIAALRAKGRTFRSIAEEVDMDERSVRRAFADHCAVTAEHNVDSEHALKDLLEMLDEQIERAVLTYERNEGNGAVAIASVRTALRGLTAKATVLATAGIIGVDGARWQSDRAAFREFVRVGIDLLTGVEQGEVSASEARERFAASLGLLEGGDHGGGRMSPTAPRPGL